MGVIVEVMGVRPKWRYFGIFTQAGRQVGESEVDFQFRFRPPMRSRFSLWLSRKPDFYVVRSDLWPEIRVADRPSAAVDLSGLDPVTDTAVVLERIKEALRKGLDLLETRASGGPR
ncbi:MAG: hypothetical protein WD063_14575 [Pirellulales bacterium]